MSLLVETSKILFSFAPLDATGAGASGDWISMKNWRRCCIVLTQGAWAAGTSAVTLEQATSAAGAGSKALAFSWRYTYVGLVGDTLVKTAVVSDTFNLPNAANTVNLIEVDSGDLDINNGFAFIRFVCATPGANADLLAGLYILYDGSFSGNPAGLPSAIA